MEDNQITVKPMSGVVAHTAPTIFADGIASFSNNKDVVKLVLFRTDSDVLSSSNFENVAAAQVIMPMGAFAHFLAMMDASRERLLKAGLLTNDQLTEARELQLKAGGI